MALATAYDALPLTIDHGKGVWLFDKHNNAYLDTFSGVAVCGLGHCHPDVTQTIQQQSAQLLHASNAYHTLQSEALAKKLTTLTSMQQAFFCNSGAEANEAAIKLARLYGHKKSIETPSIIVMEGAFHGRTMATLTASGSRKVQAGFEPLLPGFIRAPFNNLEAIHTIAANRDDVVAIMVEPIQGEAGVIVPDDAYLRQLAKICEEQDWLLIVDEVQTGCGRTGQLFAYMAYGIQPDILTTAKGLGNGVPIGACLMGAKTLNLFKPGNHGSTFGGNPLSCAAALTVLEVIERDDICQLVNKNSAILKQQLIEAFANDPHVRAIRGKGYMLGIVLDRPAHKLPEIALAHQLLLAITAEQVIRLLPPLIINEEEITVLVKKLQDSLEAFYS